MPLFAMGFEPQTAGQPLVNPHKRTTKVNIAVAIGVLIFLGGVLAYGIHLHQKTQRGEPAMDNPSPTQAPKP